MRLDLQVTEYQRVVLKEHDTYQCNMCQRNIHDALSVTVFYKDEVYNIEASYCERCSHHSAYDHDFPFEPFACILKKYKRLKRLEEIKSLNEER